jgi:hypothetical protein
MSGLVGSDAVEREGRRDGIKGKPAVISGKPPIGITAVLEFILSVSRPAFNQCVLVDGNA